MGMLDDKLHTRVIVSGRIAEIYEYEKPLPVGRQREHEIFKRKKADLPITPDGYEENLKRDDNLYRSRLKIRRLIWSNQGSYTKFLTLTYAENMIDFDVFRRNFTTFCQAMKRQGYPLRYLYVLENQERGALHAHVVVFNDEFIPLEVIQKAWPHGFVKINAIDSVNNLGAYVCKYLTKENVMEFGGHSYRCSLGLNKPREEKYIKTYQHEMEPYVLDKEKNLEPFVGNVIYDEYYTISYEAADGQVVENRVRYRQVEYRE